MRLPNARRLAGLVVSLSALAALAGCDNRKAAGTESAAGGRSGPAIEPDGGGPPARQQAEAFLKDLGEGKVGPERLTAAFRREVPAPAVEGTPRAEATDADTREWLAQFRDIQFHLRPEEVHLSNGGVSYRGRAEKGNRKEAFALRMVKEGAVYKCDWLHRSEHIELGVKPPPNADLTLAQDTVRNFLDILLGGDLRQAHALMAPAWKKKLAPPYPSDEKAGLTYNPGFLTGVTKAWKRDYTAYLLPKSELSPDRATALFAVEFQAGDRTVSYTVKVATDPATGRWTIQDLDPVKL
jgi:hypothetical protein